MRSLFITLRRSFAGCRETQLRILKSLGLGKREATVERVNSVSIRGALDKVKHMVDVETDSAYHARIAAEKAAKAMRDPVRVRHG